MMCIPLLIYLLHFFTHFIVMSIFYSNVHNLDKALQTYGHHFQKWA